MRIFMIIVLGVIFITAGCSGIPFSGLNEQKSPVQVSLNNSGNANHTFDVWVIVGGTDDKYILVRKKNGEVDNASPDQGLHHYRLDGDYGYVTSVEMPSNHSIHKGTFKLDPGSSKRMAIKNFTIGSSVIVVHKQDGRIISIVSANCDDLALLHLEVVSRPDPPGGVSPSYSCG